MILSGLKKEAQTVSGIPMLVIPAAFNSRRAAQAGIQFFVRPAGRDTGSRLSPG
jgi:hypothetical protein